MTTGLTTLKQVEPAKTPTKQRERLELIEATPQDNWFVRATTPRGRVVWYLRFEVTGMNPRLFGPFRSKRDCLLVLDDVINALADVEAEARDASEKRMVHEECHRIWSPIIEHPILIQAHSPIKNGQ